MTAQARERLLFNGEEIWMASLPLNLYLQNRGYIKFVSPSTDCWRGYRGQWEVVDNKLYLTGLTAYIAEDITADINYLFPGQNKVFADWFTGEIRIPKGELLDYVHKGFSSLYSNDLFLVFENGILTKQYEIDNSERFLERLKQREQEEKERPAKVAKKKTHDRVLNFIVISVFVLVFLGVCLVVFYLIC